MRSKAANARVFVVWEPVLSTDWGSPDPALTAMVSDPRATHYWDHDRKLSALLGGPTKLGSLAETRYTGFKMSTVIWDIALIYPPGVKWNSPAQLLLAPIVKYRQALKDGL